MRDHSDNVRTLPSSSDQYSERRDIGDLREALVAIQEERRLLKSEIVFEQHKNALMREALTKSRRAIEALQAMATAAAPVRERAPREAFRLPFALTLPRRKADPLDAKWYTRKRTDTSRYIAQSTLEALILRSAQAKLYGIRGVIIEFGWSTSAACGSNWQVTGIVSGKADRATAFVAVEDAVRENADWVMVEDGSRLDGQSIENETARRG